MSASRFLAGSPVLILLFTLVACGGGGREAQAPPPPATVSTLAYVVSECRVAFDGTGTIRQALQIQRGDQAPITVVEHSAAGLADTSVCQITGLIREGSDFARYGVFHRLGVTPDGSQVVFEVTDEVAEDPLLFPRNTLPEQEKGIFIVRADGEGLRYLGPASRVGSFFASFFVFSPNGRTIAYNDRGPSLDKEDAVQIFTLDLVTCERKQVTRLPPALLGRPAPLGDTYAPFFNDDRTITFFTHANLDGANPDGKNLVVTVKTTDGKLTIAPPVLAVAGSEVLTSFRITGSDLNAASLILSGTPVNPGVNGAFAIREVFDIDDANNVLQLTNFGRTDTLLPTASADGQRVFFSASTNQLRTNPTENCQLFSIDRDGADLRQLTDFHEAPSHSTNGCSADQPRPAGCGVFFTGQDTQSGAVVFYSSCDPSGKNRFGEQLFAVHEDGTGLRQLTNTRGSTRDPSGAVTVELPYSFAYPGVQFRNQDAVAG